MPLSKEHLAQWAQEQLGVSKLEVLTLYGDASRRRYYRARHEQSTWIIADSSAELTDVPAFIAIDETLQKLGLLVPQIIAKEVNAGLMLLEDFGDTTLLSILNKKNVAIWYQQAFDNLITLQTCQPDEHYLLPLYDDNAFMREWGIFTSWYLAKYHHVDLTQQQRLLEQTWQTILKVLHEQPRVFVHRDYHSRNLMVTQNQQLGIIDFQGAKWGPLTYDLVSLVRDCYIDWPTKQVTQWLQTMQERLWENLKIPRVSEDCFQRWCDFTGLQRHLKAMGQFARKYLVDQNTYYLGDLPRVENYVLKVCNRYPELKEFHHLLTELICAQ